jgi:primosomal protein N' (replication factor Y)
MIAQVIFNLPIDRGFDYVVPQAMEGLLRPGMRVQAPFGHRRLIGIVSRLRARTTVTHPKALLRLIDRTPVLTRDDVRLARWMSSYYCCSLGEVCATMVPTSLRVRESLMGEESATHAPDEIPDLTAQQRAVFAPIEPVLRASSHHVFLLHGVTGSGKTELYLRVVEQVLRQGRSAICLVPEIALTPQTIDRFRQRFGSTVSLWHSRLTARQRSTEWQRLAEGKSRLVVGTRSAVFAPVKRLGAIILDEEHDSSYKQDMTPRYHAREVAIARARMANAVVILGSATPSIESSYAAKHAHYQLLELPERVQGRRLPQVEIIDMREELASGQRFAPLSRRLQYALRRIVDLREQAILLLNRRGFARVILCPACGLVVRCRQCAVPLIYHATARQLVCHYCNERKTPPEMCPACQRGYLRFRGSGTERIESELHRLFPILGIARMDTDTTKRRESHRQLYESIKTQEIDVLVGTQMVAKGLDIPQVTLVGVVSADTALNLPDFRAGERTFDLLTQVAGRAGRGDRPGQVLIQTYCPDHYAIRAASRHDYHEFYRAEIRMRKRLTLPPFVHLIELTVQGRKPERVQRTAEALAEGLRSRGSRRGITVLGPAPHRLKTLRGVVRWRLVMKAHSVGPMVRVLRRCLDDGRRFHGLPVIVDVDPL